ncbi:hypothetical protein KFL_003620040 [Klebsormidium nitens]|uniref:Uncharacterized protein n=1 Tax=Klebsormidium nitens TaxID=105231 RepID=A0A1Y1IAI1_KLENI|nr:hypothetical protein KFL_003620040 [Klebsormidium nitens]|eukprot:GAQ87573.1 hypothetical protein KFL_003620040 [Klebsormidium nitens]
MVSAFCSDAAFAVHMAATLGCKFHELAEKIENAQDPERLRIHKRHQSVIEARANLHAEAGVEFYKCFSRFKDQVDDYTDHDLLVQPRVSPHPCHVEPKWSISGNSRLVVELDPKVAAANSVQEAGTDPPYVTFIRDSWRPVTPPKGGTTRQKYRSPQMQFWQETGLAEVNDSPRIGPRPGDYCHPARQYESLYLNQTASAPYAMYRMLCLFPWLVSEWRPCDYYKRLWYFIVEHKETGFEFELTEHKGSLHAYIELNPDSPWADCLKSEACALLELILSDACRHPCGVPAGSVDPVVFVPYNEEDPTKRYVVDPRNAGLQHASQEDCDNIVRVRERWRTVPEPDTSERTYRESLTITVDPPSRMVCILELEQTLQGAPFERGLCGQVSFIKQSGGKMVPLCAAISSGLFLYRLISIFTHDMMFDSCDFAPNRSLADLPKFINPPNPANSLWYTEIAHVATGHVVRVGEFRGATTVWSVSGTDSLTTETEVAAVKEDLEWLLALVCGRCPHTYDGVLAGCHA